MLNSYVDSDRFKGAIIMTMKEVSHAEAEKMMVDLSHTLCVIDVRDKASFDEAHIVGASHFSMETLQAFCDEVQTQTPILVCCRHGISSQAVAHHLIECGFTEVYSLIGGFEEWRVHHPVSNTQDTEQ